MNAERTRAYQAVRAKARQITDIKAYRKERAKVLSDAAERADTVAARESGKGAELKGKPKIILNTLPVLNFMPAFLPNAFICAAIMI